MKKKAVQKKARQKVAPVIRFREVGSGELERIVIIPKKRTPKENPVQIEAVVLKILEDIEKNKGKENGTFLLQLLFRVLGRYLGAKASDQNDPLLRQIYEKFSSVATFLYNKELGKGKKIYYTGFKKQPKCLLHSRLWSMRMVQ